MWQSLGRSRPLRPLRFTSVTQDVETLGVCRAPKPPVCNDYENREKVSSEGVGNEVECPIDRRACLSPNRGLHVQHWGVPSTGFTPVIQDVETSGGCLAPKTLRLNDYEKRVPRDVEELLTNKLIAGNPCSHWGVSSTGNTPVTQEVESTGVCLEPKTPSFNAYQTSMHNQARTTMVCSWCAWFVSTCAQTCSSSADPCHGGC